MEKLEAILEELRELLKEGKYSPIRSLVEHLEEADIAWLLGQLERSQMVPFFRILPKETAAEVFVELEADEQQTLIEGFSDGELKNVVDSLFLDDAVDVIEEMPANVVRRILHHAAPEVRAGINDLLKYPKDSVGSIMSPECVALRADMLVKDAFLKIRKLGLRQETVYTCYVVDDHRHLQGVVTVLELLLADLEQTVESIMDRDVVSFKTLDDQETAARAFDKYDYLAFPVVDGENRLLGIITVDDAMDVIQEENTEDIEKMAAITPSERPYLKTGAFDTFRQRIPWLLLLMVSATFTGQIIAHFENALATQAVLISFIPMLMDTGGNSGSQASVTVIRGLSLQEIRFSDLFKIIWKEVRVSVLCGLCLAAANFLKIILIDNIIFHGGVSLTVAAVVCVTLCLTVLVAKVVGCTLPMLAKKVGFDPAVMASPFITTIVDAISLLIYFAIASIVLQL